MKKRTLFALAVTGLGLAAAAGLFRINTDPAVFIDLDGDGLVTPREALSSLDLGQRPAEIDGRRCTEIFELKDGETIRTHCDLASPAS
ncbi:hypothetical protein [Vannielia litorea]|uniref:hypothetical protein n=1 Tax=Vannielia litorea TaxID=1217970 RepID=UPI001BD0A1C3|nr:hypothetical protein [Vannielia litorea]MBS8228068.1 hypothetical protein [Vannielia litorea]